MKSWALELALFLLLGFLYEFGGELGRRSAKRMVDPKDEEKEPKPPILCPLCRGCGQLEDLPKPASE